MRKVRQNSRQISPKFSLLQIKKITDELLQERREKIFSVQSSFNSTIPFVVPVPQQSRAAKRGCFKRGGFPIWTRPSFFVLFCPFGTFPGIFPICTGMVRGFSRLVLFLFLSLLRAPTRNSPERVRDTIWTIPEKSGKHPGLETPRFSFSQPTRLSSRTDPCSVPSDTKLLLTKNHS